MTEKETAQDLRDRINKCQTIINGLENNDAFNLLIEDFKSTAKRLDDNWQWLQEEKALQQAQMTKMATMAVVQAIENYKHDLDMASKRLEAMENPDVIQVADYDNEGVKNG